MRRILISLLAGWLAGLLAAGTVVLTCDLYRNGRNIWARYEFEMLWEIAWSASPGVLLLDGVLLRFLRKGASVDRPRGTTLTIGMLVGAALALPVLLTALWLAGRGEEITWLLHLVRGSSRINLGAALAGGAVHGLVTAWVISRPSKEGA